MSDVKDQVGSLRAALAAVMAELPGIGKDDRAPEKAGGYSYRGIEAITRHLQPLLAKHGVVIVPNAVVTQIVPSPGMKEGWTDVHMRVEWTILGPGTGTIKAATTGIGRDNADKGANKAQTQAFKYLLLHLFCIADGADDSDGADYTAGTAPPSAPAEDWEGIAREKGWGAVAAAARQEERFRELVARTNALPDDKADRVRQWVKERAFTLRSLTTWQAGEWAERIRDVTDPTPLDESPPDPPIDPAPLEPAGAGDVPVDDNGDPL